MTRIADPDVHALGGAAGQSNSLPIGCAHSTQTLLIVLHQDQLKCNSDLANQKQAGTLEQQRAMTKRSPSERIPIPRVAQEKQPTCAPPAFSMCVTPAFFAQ
jgi:hypothetical protein